MIEPRELSSQAPASPPLTLIVPPPAPGLVPVWSPLAWGFVGVAFLMSPLVPHLGWLEGRGPGTAVSVLAVACFIWALTLSVRVIRQRHGWLAAAGAVQVLLALPLTLLGALIVLIVASGGFRRGRQLRKRGRLQLPLLGRGTGWATLPSCATADAEEAAAVAAQWRENGRTEHASVAAFARLSLDLLGLGAPARLLAQAQADGQDEILHAELCFSLAKALDGRDLEPVAFQAAARAGPRSRVRSLALIELAIDSLVEGALHEGLSAAVVAKLASSCQNSEIRPILAEIAEDEGRHAAHAWDVLEWCLAQGGLAVRAAIGGALQVLPERHEPSQPVAAREGAWTRYGIHGEQLEREAYAKVRDSVVRRARRLLVEGRNSRTSAAA